MLLTQQPLTAHSVVYTLNPDCYPATLVLDNGQEVCITDDMVERACRMLENSFYPFPLPTRYEVLENRSRRVLTLVG
jgi:hypothetical protein